MAMITSNYEERIRKETIMKEVLPDEAMWIAWEKTEAPLRKGRGWYPALDKRFLELLVETEIDLHSLTHDVSSPLPLERCERNRDKIRRVALARIGQERLEAYCSRVAEAFQGYCNAREYGVGMWDQESSESGESERGTEGLTAKGDGEVEHQEDVGKRMEGVVGVVEAGAGGVVGILSADGGGVVAVGAASGLGVSAAVTSGVRIAAGGAEGILEGKRGRDRSPKHGGGRAAKTQAPAASPTTTKGLSLSSAADAAMAQLAMVEHDTDICMEPEDVDQEIKLASFSARREREREREMELDRSSMLEVDIGLA